MPFIQAKSSASGPGAFSSIVISFDAPVTAGNAVVAFLYYHSTPGPFQLICTDSLGNTWQPYGGGGNQSYTYRFGLLPTGGNCTVTFTQTQPGVTLGDIAVSILEYSGMTPNPYGFWGRGVLNQEVIQSRQDSPTVTHITGNKVWTPNTLYSGEPNNFTLYEAISDTRTPATIQGLGQEIGISGSTAPNWTNTSTPDNGLTWFYFGLTPPAYQQAFFMIATYPFVEFPAPSDGWTLRTSASQSSGIAVYDAPLDVWNREYTASFTKATASPAKFGAVPFGAATFASGPAVSDSISWLLNLTSEPPPDTGRIGMFGTFVGFFRRGMFGGGN
jgi:hypothetical protein